jgi:hypothetical protein
MKSNMLCRLHYRMGRSHQDADKAGTNKNSKNDDFTVKVIEAPIMDVVPSSFDWSWYPSAYAEPYTAYCSLPSEKKLSKLFKNAPLKTPHTFLPFAVSLLPVGSARGKGGPLYEGE